MSELGDLIGKLIAAVIELMVQAALFAWTLLLAVFNPVHRRKLRKSWNTSALYQGKLVIGGVCFMVAVVLMAFSGLFRLGGPKNTESKEPANVIQFTDEEQQNLLATNGIGSIAGKAAEIISKRVATKGEDALKETPSKP